MKQRKKQFLKAVVEHTPSLAPALAEDLECLLVEQKDPWRARWTPAAMREPSRAHLHDQTATSLAAKPTSLRASACVGFFGVFLRPISEQISKEPFNGTNGKEAFKAAAASSVWVCERHSAISLPPANRWVGAAIQTTWQREDSVLRAGSITRHYSDAHGTLARQKPQPTKDQLAWEPPATTY